MAKKPEQWRRKGLSALEQSIEQRSGEDAPTVIAVFNFKGGVAKTTTILNLASAMAALQKQVLLVDADPQCNLTSFYTRGDEAKEGNEELLGPSKAKTKGSNLTIIADALSPHPKAKAFDVGTHGSGAFDGNLHDRLKSALLRAAAEPPQPRGVCGGLVYLIPGHPLLFKMEVEFSKLDGTMLAQEALTSFRKIIDEAALRVNADIVLVDFGPSAGILNKVFVLQCDYILPTARADYFSYYSIQAMLDHLLPEWFEWYSKQSWAGFPQQPPPLLPFLITGYGIYTPGGSKKKTLTIVDQKKKRTLTIAASAWVQNIKKLVKKAPQEVQTAFHPVNDEMVIPFMQDLKTLAQECQKERVSFFEYKGSTHTNTKAMVKMARGRYLSVAEVLLQLDRATVRR